MRTGRRFPNPASKRPALRSRGTLPALALAFGLAGAAGAQQFGPEELLPDPTTLATAVRAADLDGDGDLDVLSAGRTFPVGGDDHLGWFENLNGQGVFALHPIASGPGTPDSVCVVDIDGDADPDFLLALSGSDQVVWYENLDGRGSFALAQVLTSSLLVARWVHAADLDGDGDPDALATSYNDDEIVWFENQDGLGGFGAEQFVSASGDGPRGIHAADVDADGDLDVIAALSNANEVVWYPNDGTGAFGLPVLIAADLDEPVAVRTADVDGDGDQDLFASARLGVRLAWYENEDGFGAFGPQQVVLFSAFFEANHPLRPADLDQDGDVDLLTNIKTGAQPGWFENEDGLGGFGPPQLISNDPDPGQVASVDAADLDGDGDLDVLAPFYQASKIAWYANESCCALTADVDSISLAAGGAQVLELDAGAAKGLGLSWLQTTTTGTSPGSALQPAPFKLPLNLSGLLLLTLTNPNLLIPSSLDFLDAAGRSTTTLTLSPGLDPGLAGATLHHAYVVLELNGLALELTGVSNAVALSLLP